MAAIAFTKRLTDLSDVHNSGSNTTAQHSNSITALRPTASTVSRTNTNGLGLSKEMRSLENREIRIAGRGGAKETKIMQG